MNRFETWLATKWHGYHISKPLKATVAAGLFVLAAAVIGLLGTLLSGVLQLITTSIQARNDERTPSEIHNVTSHNQSGGITAHTVNAFPEPRRLNNEECESLSIKASPYADRPILVDTILNDREAIIFAKDTENCFRGKGFKVEGIQQTMYEVSPEGQDVHVYKDKILIRIGVAKRK